MHSVSKTTPAPAPGAPARNGGRSAAPDSNPFASLEQETTQAFQVSNELLEMARDNAVSNGATKAYEVPAELLEMARARKLAKQAANRAAPSAREAEAPAAVRAPSAPVPAPAVPIAPQVTFSELSAEEQAWIESAMAAPPAPLADDVDEGTVAYPDVPPESHVVPTRASLAPPVHVSAPVPSLAAPKPRRMRAAMRFALATLSVIVLLAIGFQCVRLIQALESSSLEGLRASDRRVAVMSQSAVDTSADQR